MMKKIWSNQPATRLRTDFMNRIVFTALLLIVPCFSIVAQDAGDFLNGNRYTFSYSSWVQEDSLVSTSGRFVIEGISQVSWIQEAGSSRTYTYEITAREGDMLDYESSGYLQMQLLSNGRKYTLTLTKDGEVVLLLLEFTTRSGKNADIRFTIDQVLYEKI